MPPNDPLVHCICAYQRYRIMIGFSCMTEAHLKQIQTHIRDYERYCEVQLMSLSRDYAPNTDIQTAACQTEIWEALLISKAARYLTCYC
jgi:hypothetical protein